MRWVASPAQERPVGSVGGEGETPISIDGFGLCKTTTSGGK